MIIKVKQPINLSSYEDNKINRKQFEIKEELEYVKSDKFYHPYYETYKFNLKVKDYTGTSYDINACGYKDCNEVYVNGVVGQSFDGTVKWNDVFEGECPIVIKS